MHTDHTHKHSSKFSLFLNLFSWFFPYFWDLLSIHFRFKKFCSQVDDNTTSSKQTRQLSYCPLFHLFAFLLCSYWTKIMLHASGSFHHQTSYNPISLFLIFFFYDFSLFSHLQSFHVIFICEYCRSIYFYRYFHIYNFCWIITIILLT